MSSRRLKLLAIFVLNLAITLYRCHGRDSTLTLLFVVDSSVSVKNNQFLTLRTKFIPEIINEFLLYRPLVSVLSFSDDSVETIIDLQHATVTNVGLIDSRIVNGLVKSESEIKKPIWGLTAAVNILSQYADTANNLVVIMWFLGSHLSGADIDSFNRIRNRVEKLSKWNLLIVSLNHENHKLENAKLHVYDLTKLHEIKIKIYKLIQGSFRRINKLKFL